MYREEKIVIKNETFTDIAIKELADVKARLLIYKFYHMENKAHKLPAFQQLDHCYSQMNDYDKMRVDSRAADLFGKYMQKPDGFMPYAVLKRRYFKCWLMLFISFLLTAYLFVFFEGTQSIYNIVTELAEQPEDKPPLYQPHNIDMEQAVHNTILELDKIVYDISEQNGLLNCTDYAIEFKILWDMKYPGIPCHVVWNINPGIINHLLVEINGQYYEPWSANYPKGKHDMQSVWGKSGRYDPKYNQDGSSWYNMYIKNRMYW